EQNRSDTARDPHDGTLVRVDPEPGRAIWRGAATGATVAGDGGTAFPTPSRPRTLAPFRAGQESQPTTGGPTHGSAAAFTCTRIRSRGVVLCAGVGLRAAGRRRGRGCCGGGERAAGCGQRRGGCAGRAG